MRHDIRGLRREVRSVEKILKDTKPTPQTAVKLFVFRNLKRELDNQLRLIKITNPWMDNRVKF